MAKRQTGVDPWLKRLTNSFERRPNPSTASELYETALLYGKVEQLPREIAHQVGSLRHAISLPTGSSLQYGASQEIPSLDLRETSNVHEESARKEIGRLRKLLAENSARPFCWSELARHFLIVAENKKAIRCMQAALQLAEGNRYLCRAAARLFVHTQDPDRALGLLRAEPQIKQDPWLLAAEIAISSITRKKSRLVDAGQRLVGSEGLSHNQLSELAAALGTIELDHGAIKKAKSLFSKSLIEPTENALAQAQWAVEQNSKILIPQSAWNTPASFEANALASRRAQNWNHALEACAAWLADEPFSGRPALMGSYIGFRPEHVRTAEQFATAGLRRDNSNHTLLNNRAVARVYQGKVAAAYEDVEAALALIPARDSAHLMATLGLIAFRAGMPNDGRKFYETSISWLSQTKQPTGVASAILHLLREEVRIDQSVIPEAVDIVKKISNSPAVFREPEIKGMTELFFEEVALWKNKNSGASTNFEVSPGSPDQFNYFASLFNVPEKAKLSVPTIKDFASLL